MSIDILKDALHDINRMDSEYQTLEMAMDIAGEALKEFAATQQPIECAKAFELFWRVRGQWMFDNQKLALDSDFTERAEKFAFDMIWNMRPSKRESGKQDD